MGNNNAHQRLTQVREYLINNGKARTQKEIAELMGASRPNVAKALNGDTSYLTENFLKRFAAAYADYINAEYLLTGNGPLARPARDSRPHIPTAVSAGYTDVAIASVALADVENRPLITSFPSYDFTIEVEGDSMLPLISDGDTIACRRLENIDQLRTGRIYVVESADGALVKQLAALTTRTVTLHSLNPDPKYKNITLPADLIISLSQVVGLLRPLTL